MTKPTFSSEQDLHDWFKSLLLSGEDGLASVISNREEIETYQPANAEQRGIKSSFEYVLESLYYTEIIADDENISTTPGEILRPDFLLYSSDSENIVVVELKNLAGPTRQAGTEASAYAAEVRSYLPFISDGDVVTVLVSTVWPTLLCHYVAHEIIWIGRKIICLEPNDETSLAIVPVDRFAAAQKPIQISGKEFGGYQLCLYDDELYTRMPIEPDLIPSSTACAPLCRQWPLREMLFEATGLLSFGRIAGISLWHPTASR